MDIAASHFFRPAAWLNLKKFCAQQACLQSSRKVREVWNHSFRWRAKIKHDVSCLALRNDVGVADIVTAVAMVHLDCLAWIESLNSHPGSRCDPGCSAAECKN